MIYFYPGFIVLVCGSAFSGFLPECCGFSSRCIYSWEVFHRHFHDAKNGAGS